ncbi:hypothetical protein MFLO_07102 [Listeria floridensis FSL S10-1187]|uniref:ABC transporter permease n=1 Tax=Listeria floridensis FSL S10-1187 TaxID=1265817 RepID=A0ABP3B0C9_9LIST|nr:ABC transporter permease subunit [Listeria floridensis]EUJ32293.1 hypothetical protein MFLO_07102 [Listeria floridensis FSL S10-1187]
MFQIMQLELKTAFRQKTIYLFSLLWIVILMFLFILQSSVPGVLSYTNTTSTIMNLVFILIPLITLINAALSLSGEKENGQFKLIGTYPLSNTSYVLGKLAGQAIVQWVTFTFSYGISLAIATLVGLTLDIKWIFFLYSFAIFLTYLFLLMGILIGLFSKNRWSALSIAVFAWFFLIMFWPTFFISILNLLPYAVGDWIVKAAIFLNPAEFLRLVYVSQLGGGSIFGQNYDSLVSTFSTGLGWMFLGYYLIVVTVLSVFAGDFLLFKRRR